MVATNVLAMLYRRAGFGATASELRAASSLGYSASVQNLLKGISQPDPQADLIVAPAFMQPPFHVPNAKSTQAEKLAFNRQLAQEQRALQTWWISKMVAAQHPLKEKLTFFLHCHFPTAISKVRFSTYMYRQNQIFRTIGGGDFETLTKAVATDPAMLIWLDAATDKLPDPNENFARELMERFTMGIGNYTEFDVRAAAFAFTGWHVNQKTGLLAINPKGMNRTPQKFLGHSGVTTGQEVISIVTNSIACARFVTASVWSRFAYPIKTSDPIVIELADKFGSERNITNLLSMVFEHPEFQSSQSLTGLIKQPAEYVVGALRALAVESKFLSKMETSSLSVLASLGQVLFDPPSVGGWPQNEYWLSTAAALARWRFAHQLSLVGDIAVVADASQGSRPEAAAELLSVYSWSNSTADVLRKASNNPHTLVALALTSPEYVLN